MGCRMAFFSNGTGRRNGMFLVVWMVVCYIFFHAYLSNSVYLDKIYSTKVEQTASSDGLVSFFNTLKTKAFSASSKLLLPIKEPLSSEWDRLTELERLLPNLPVLNLYNHTKTRNHRTKTCGQLPALYDIRISNQFWQVATTSNGTLYLYGAYLDLRKLNPLGPTVRILGMMDRLKPKVKTHCQLWFADTHQPVVSEVVEYKYIWYRAWGYNAEALQPYLLACKLPNTHLEKELISVSIVEHKCDKATNNLRVIYDPPKGAKKEFAVCVKGLDYPDVDLSLRLMEWIELLSELGADKIYFYKLKVHPNMNKVIDYYVKKRMVEITPITLPGYQPNVNVLQHMFIKSRILHKRLDELIPYNDCLYRNLYKYKYIALLDIDEVIMPRENERNWSELMKTVEEESLKVKNQTWASYNFRNVFFMDEFLQRHLKQANGSHAELENIPEHMYMLRHVYRSAKHVKPGNGIKCFHNPEKVHILHNHFPFACVNKGCPSFPVSTSLAQLQHYRGECPKEYKNVTVLDTSIWKYKDAVIDRVNRALQELG